ncbi:MAG: PadR family transcriptional regulator [Candidatus Hodarchaeota archaeon]
MDLVEKKLDRWLKEMRRGTLEFWVLTLLNEEPMYGAKLCKILSDWSKGLVDIKAGTIYPLLKRLEEDGWIEETTMRIQEGEKGPERRIYGVTNTGEQLIKAMAESWTSIFENMFRKVEKNFKSLKRMMENL